MPISCLHICPKEGSGKSCTFIEMEIYQLKKLGIDVEQFFFDGERNPLNYIKGAIELKSYVKEKDFDIIHIHFGQSAILCVLLGAKYKVVTTVHGSELLGIVSQKGHYRKWLTQLVRLQTRIGLRLPAIKGVIFVSKKLKTLSYLRCAKNSTVISCGADPELFRPRGKEQARRKLGLPLNKKVIFFPADPKRGVKNFAFLDMALKKLSRPEEYHLLVPQNYNLDQMASAYNACDCIVVCSLHEGSPTVVKEAILSGTPVISQDIGDVSELAKTFHNIHIAKDGDGFISLLDDFLDEKLGRKLNADMGSIRADETAKRLKDFYMEVLEI